MTAARYRWGIVGTSPIAEKFVRQLRQTEFGEAYAVSSRSSERAARFAKAHGVTRAFDSYEAMLADDGVDVVYVATPSRKHLEHCLMAIERDKAVMCEKPLAITQAQGEEIVSAARERGVFCMEAMWLRFHPLVQRLRSAVRAGDLGDIHYLHAELGWPKGKERVERPELGRGARLDFGVYPLSFAQYLLGTPDRVDTFARKHPAGGDETVAAQLVYPGCVASVSASVSAELSNDALVVGSKATARLGRPLLSPSWLEVLPRDASPSHRLARRLTRPLARWRRTPHIGFRREAEEVMRCLDAGKLESDVVPLSDTLWTLGCTDLMVAPVGARS